MRAFNPKNIIIFKMALSFLKSLIEAADINFRATYIIGFNELRNK